MSRQIRRRAPATGIACFSRYKSKEKRHDDLFRPRHAARRCASVGVGYAIGAQPHMNESIALLLSARGEL
jgi:hypothetical protein